MPTLHFLTSSLSLSAPKAEKILTKQHTHAPNHSYPPAPTPASATSCTSYDYTQILRIPLLLMLGA